jgi:GAF domain-containing protein
LHEAESPLRSTNRADSKASVKTAFRVLVAVFLAYAWTWTSLLKEWNWLSDKTRVWVLVGCGIVFVVQQFVQNRRKPATREEVSNRRAIAEIYLENLVAQYLKIINPQTALQTLPPIRTNLMFPAHRAFSTRLAIAYQYCVPGTAYPNDERDLRLKKGEAACGMAWKTRHEVSFDAAKAPHLIPTRHLQILGGVKSVLAVPVLRSSEVVGILCLDSASGIADTQFDQTDVVRLALSYARNLEGICFSDGIQD